MMDSLRIIGVAMKHQTTAVVFHQLGPASHVRIEDLMGIHELYGDPRSWDKGFIASDGKFYGREEAFDIAKEAGQLRDPNETDRYLTSENIKW